MITVLKTVPFGGSLPEPYDGVDEYYADHPILCENCLRELEDGDEAYLIGGDYYCTDCRDAAAEAVFDAIGDEYIVTVEH